MELLTLQEKGMVRIYNFLEFDEKTDSFVHRQLENRNGKIFMRSKIRSF